MSEGVTTPCARTVSKPILKCTICYVTLVLSSLISSFIKCTLCAILSVRTRLFVNCLLVISLTIIKYHVGGTLVFNYGFLDRAGSVSRHQEDRCLCSVGFSDIFNPSVARAAVTHCEQTFGRASGGVWRFCLLVTSSYFYVR